MNLEPYQEEKKLTVIKVIEPQSVLRFGLQQLMSETLPHASVEGLDYDDLYSAGSSDKACDLALLSISSNGQLNGQVEAVKRVCGPKAILLLVETNEMLPPASNGHPIVRGVIRKNVTPELLKASVKLVLAGGTCFPAQGNNSTSQKSLFSLYEPTKWPLETTQNEESPAEEECGEAKLLGLTPRQYEVLVLLAQGHPLKIVGRRLNISVATAKAHTETLYRRLNVHNRNAAVYTAVSRGATLGWSNVSANRPENRPGPY